MTQSSWKRTHFHNAHIRPLKAWLDYHARSTMDRLTSCYTSAAEFHSDGRNTSTLRTQYRMHDACCRVVAANFYYNAERYGMLVFGEHTPCCNNCAHVVLHLSLPPCQAHQHRLGM